MPVRFLHCSDSMGVLEECHIPLAGSFVSSLVVAGSVGALLRLCIFLNPRYFYTSAPVLCLIVITFMEVMV